MKTLLLTIAACSLLIGCNIATRHGEHPDQEEWHRAELVPAVHHGGGTSAAASAATCYYKDAARNDLYHPVNASHPHCPPAIAVDVNSYRVHIDPLMQGYKYNFKVLTE